MSPIPRGGNKTREKRETKRKGEIGKRKIEQIEKREKGKKNGKPTL